MIQIWIMPSNIVAFVAATVSSYVVIATQFTVKFVLGRGRYLGVEQRRQEQC